NTVTPNTTSTIQLVINDRLTNVISDLLREVPAGGGCHRPRWNAAGGGLCISRALTSPVRKSVRNCDRRSRWRGQGAAWRRPKPGRGVVRTRALRPSGRSGADRASGGGRGVAQRVRAPREPRNLSEAAGGEAER